MTGSLKKTDEGKQAVAEQQTQRATRRAGMDRRDLEGRGGGGRIIISSDQLVHKNE